jgi:hypothetical protein
MGASDFLSGRGPRLGSRVLADFMLARRAHEPDSAGHRPQVLQRSGGPTQLSLFDHLEPRSNAIDLPPTDPVSGTDTVAVEPPADPV